MLSVESFLKNYWNYFLEIEAQLYQTKKYVEFDSQNGNAYSLEYLQLYQAVCSEIDVIGKELALCVCDGFEVNNITNIKKLGYAIQQAFPELKNSLVVFYDYLIQQPFKNWEYIKSPSVDKNGNVRHSLKLVNEKAIPCWREYNNVKHQRVGLVSGSKNYCKANQKNLLLAFSALYVFEWKKMMLLKCEEHTAECRLFKIKQVAVEKATEH